jgi:histidyl-tRNA synthetase
VPFVAIVGDDERAGHQVAIKDIRSGEQTTVARADAAAFIASGMQKTSNDEPQRSQS